MRLAFGLSFLGAKNPQGLTLRLSENWTLEKACFWPALEQIMHFFASVEVPVLRHEESSDFLFASSGSRSFKLGLQSKA